MYHWNYIISIIDNILIRYMTLVESLIEHLIHPVLKVETRQFLLNLSYCTEGKATKQRFEPILKAVERNSEVSFICQFQNDYIIGTIKI